MSRFVRTTSWFLPSLVAIVGCSGNLGGADAGRTAYPVRVVAVERVYGDIARQLGGGLVSVKTVLAPSADPRRFSPTAADASAVANADVVVENGLGYDAFVDRLVRRFPKSGRTVIDVGVLARRTHGSDPHLWYDVPALVAYSNAFTHEIEWRRQDGIPNDNTYVAHRRNVFGAWISSFEAREQEIASRSAGVRVASLVPAFDYVLRASHLRYETTENEPHGNEAIGRLILDRQVDVLVYDAGRSTASRRAVVALARSHGVALVEVTGSLPPGETPQHWMDREVGELADAVARARATARERPVTP